MDRNELTLVIAGALTGAVLLGWVLHWVFARLGRGGAASLSQTRDLAGRLHAAELALEASDRRATDLAARLAEAEVERDGALQDLDAARIQAEEVRAAYRAAMAERRA